MKYGIFSANGEVKEKEIETAWDMYYSDTDRKKLIESFDTLEAATAALFARYKADVALAKSNGGYYFWYGTVYFVAEIIEDEDGEIMDGEGYYITEFGR